MSVYVLVKSKTQLSSYNLDVLLTPVYHYFKIGSYFASHTKFQQDIYQRYASSVICIDSTHKTNVYDFKLVTLMVIDEYGEDKFK